VARGHSHGSNRNAGGFRQDAPFGSGVPRTGPGHECGSWRETVPGRQAVKRFQALMCCASQKKHEKIGAWLQGWRPPARVGRRQNRSRPIARRVARGRMRHQNVLPGSHRPSRAVWPAKTTIFVVLQHTEFAFGRLVRRGTLFARGHDTGSGAIAGRGRGVPGWSSVTGAFWGWL